MTDYSFSYFLFHIHCITYATYVDFQKYNSTNVQRASFEWIYKHIDVYIDNHKDTLDVDNPRDFVDLFLIKEKEDNDKPTFTRKTLTVFSVSAVVHICIAFVSY